MRCKGCGYESTGGDDEMGQNLKATIERFPGMIDCELCGEEPEILFYSDEDYKKLRKRLKIEDNVIVFVKTVPKT